MIVQLKLGDPRLDILANSPESWRKDWSKDDLDSIFVASRNGLPIGRVAVYRNRFFEDDGIAFIGAYECVDDYKIAEKLLLSATSYLKNTGAKQIIGPMDGSVWNHYRFKEKTSNSPFFLEPQQAIWYPKQWQKFGFVVCQNYISSIMPIQKENDNYLNVNKNLFSNNGIKIRNFNPKKSIRDLQLLADLNLASFKSGYLFSPISKEDFMKKYLPIVESLDKDLIFLAEDEEGLAGFILGVPDYLDKSGKRAVVKTLARKPDKKYAGLGKYLSRLFIEKSKKLGYSYLIHALMRKDNSSLKLSESLGGKIYSKYNLYSYH